jgi:type II secretory pathway pseudopilin PulG
MVNSHGQPEILAKNEMRRQAGFTFLSLMFAVAIAGIALAGTGALWQMESRREKEKELLFIGEEYRRAISSYYDKSPGGTKQFPNKLEDLLQDKRFPNPTHHLRRLYRDPMTADGEWGLIKQEGRIMGVASRSSDKPIKIAGFSVDQGDFEGAASYAEWRFISNGGGQQTNANASGQASGAQSSQER